MPEIKKIIEYFTKLNDSKIMLKPCLDMVSSYLTVPKSMSLHGFSRLQIALNPAL
jgi:hypothetical protein